MAVESTFLKQLHLVSIHRILYFYLMKNILLLLLMTFSLSASAQFTNDTLGNTVIHELNGSEQSVPLTATTSDGKTYISWFDNSSGQYTLRMQLIDMDGINQWASGGVVVSSFPQNSALFRYDLEVDKEDNAIVAFQDERTGTLQVVAYKITPFGTSAWGNGVVLQDSTSDGLSPRVTVTNANDVIVAWNASLGSSKWVAYSKISAGGQLQWTKRIWNNQKYSRAVMLPASTSGFQMLYVQESGSFPGVTSTMYFQRFDSSGTAQWVSPVLVSSKTISFFFFPEIISNLNDGVYIAFNTGNPSNPMMNDVYAQEIDSTGALWSATGTQCANSTTEHKLVGGFCTNSTGTEICVALQVLNSSQSNSGISLQRLDNSGNLLLGTNALNIRPISANYYLPVGITDEQNGVMITYVLGGFNSQTISCLLTDYNGLPLWSYDPMISAFLSNKEDVSCGPYANGQVVIVWQDDRVDGGIYAQNVSANGGFGPQVSVEEFSLVREAMIFPNPSAYPKMKVWSDKQTTASIHLENLIGETVSTLTIDLQKGENLLSLPEPSVAGIYIVRILGNNQDLWQGKWVRP